MASFQVRFHGPSWNASSLLMTRTWSWWVAVVVRAAGWALFRVQLGTLRFLGAFFSIIRWQYRKWWSISWQHNSESSMLPC